MQCLGTPHNGLHYSCPLFPRTAGHGHKGKSLRDWEEKPWLLVHDEDDDDEGGDPSAPPTGGIPASRPRAPSIGAAPVWAAGGHGNGGTPVKEPLSAESSGAPGSMERDDLAPRVGEDFQAILPEMLADPEGAGGRGAGNGTTCGGGRHRGRLVRLWVTEFVLAGDIWDGGLRSLFGWRQGPSRSGVRRWCGARGRWRRMSGWRTRWGSWSGGNWAAARWRGDCKSCTPRRGATSR
jgi:hypothetical protein